MCLGILIGRGAGAPGSGAGAFGNGAPAYKFEFSIEIYSLMRR